MNKQDLKQAAQRFRKKADSERLAMLRADLHYLDSGSVQNQVIVRRARRDWMEAIKEWEAAEKNALELARRASA